MKLLILGYGQYGKVAKEIAESMNCFDEIFFLDDYAQGVKGKIADIDSFEYDFAVTAIGNPEFRKAWQDKEKFTLSLIHPQASVSPSAKIGKGCIIEAGARISSNAVIGNGCIIMSNAVVGHDSVVEGFCQLKYGCVITERQTVSEGSKIECNEVI